MIITTKISQTISNSIEKCKTKFKGLSTSTSLGILGGLFCLTLLIALFGRSTNAEKKSSSFGWFFIICIILLIIAIIVIFGLMLSRDADVIKKVHKLEVNNKSLTDQANAVKDELKKLQTPNNNTLITTPIDNSLVVTTPTNNNSLSFTPITQI